MYIKYLAQSVGQSTYTKQTAVIDLAFLLHGESHGHHVVSFGSPDGD